MTPRSMNPTMRKGESSSSKRVDEMLFGEIPQLPTDDAITKKFKNMSSTNLNLFICSKFERKHGHFNKRGIVDGQVLVMGDLKYIQGFQGIVRRQG